MTDVENDVLETIKLSRYSKHNSFDKYGPVYPYANEDLESLLSDVFSFEKLPYVRNMNGFFINSGVVLTKKRGRS